MAQKFIFQMNGMTKRLSDGRELLKNFRLSFFPGAKIGIIGSNGAGKSTILRIMAGEDTDFDGHTWRDPESRVGYLAQEPRLDPSLTVRENIALGVAHQRSILDAYDAVNERFGEVLSDDEMDALLEEQASLQDQIDAAGLWDLDRHIEIAMDALRVPPGDADVTVLSGGERRRVALCQLLLSKPDLLLLDEPTNHLDAESVAWLERHLSEYGGTIVFITHDRYFLDNVAGWILEIENGHGVPWEGNYSSWLDQKEKKLADQAKSSNRRQRLLKELEWIKMGSGARRNRSKARIKQYEQLLSSAQGDQSQSRRVDIAIPHGPRLGEMVVSARGVRKAFGDQLLMESLNFDLPRGGIVGVIGPNGAGKTTLFKMMTGEEQPDAGEFRVGETVRLAYVDQLRENLDDSKGVWQNISGGTDLMYVGGQEINSRAYTSAFGFRGSRQNQIVSTLSGGERNRLNLAMLLQSGGNLLLLDEPTNDLDVGTLRSLEEALENFAGCAVIISHDRWFLDRIATHILAFEGDSQTVWFEGNYEDYEKDRRQRLGEKASRPSRIQYRSLTR